MAGAQMNEAAAAGGSGAEVPQDAALRAALEHIRLLAAQSKLLALNTAFEAAGAAAPEVATLALEVDRAVLEADCAGSAVEALLQQISAASAYVRH